MAIILLGKTTCSLCNQLLRGDEDILGFPHFIHDPLHPLWRFSDSGMHKECFLSWENAEAFRNLYNELWPKLVPQHPRRMRDDGEIEKEN
jgi:hypothetical protein